MAASEPVATTHPSPSLEHLAPGCLIARLHDGEVSSTWRVVAVPCGAARLGGGPYRFALIGTAVQTCIGSAATMAELLTWVPDAERTSWALIERGHWHWVQDYPKEEYWTEWPGLVRLEQS